MTPSFDPQGPNDGPFAYEWAAVRLVPQVHREEFVNVGVLLHSRTQEFLKAVVEPDWARVESLFPGASRDTAKRHLAAFVARCMGEELGDDPVARLPPSERFHWLTAPKSAVVQTSPVRQGLASNLAAEVLRLFTEQCSQETSGCGGLA